VGWTSLAASICGSGLSYYQQSYTGGATGNCPQGTPRSVILTFACGNAAGAAPVITSVTESPQCTYNIAMTVDCSANTAAPGTLCTAPSAPSVGFGGWLASRLLGGGSPAGTYTYAGSDGVSAVVV
jgi:hypothetical protein